MNELYTRLKNQKGIDVKFNEIKNTNHFFKNKENELRKTIFDYVKDKTEIM